MKGYRHGLYRFWRAVPSVLRMGGGFSVSGVLPAGICCGVMAEGPEKKAGASNGQLSKNVASEDEDVLRDLMDLKSNANSGDVSAQFELSRPLFERGWP